MVFLNGQQRLKVSEFSGKFLLIAGLIPDAQDWLQWAVEVDTSVAYHAVSEDDFLVQIAEGLHESPEVLLNHLRLDIRTLTAMKEPEIKLLIQHDQAEPADPTVLLPFLQGLDLLGYQQLSTIVSQLSDKGVDLPARFQHPALADQICLYHFAQYFTMPEETQSNKVMQEALAFAATYAGSIIEYTHLYRFYMTATKKQLSKNVTVSQRKKRIQSLYNQLASLTNYLIYAPSIGVGLSNQELQAQLQKLVAQQRFIGFRTKAAAMYNLVNNLTIEGNSEEAIKKETEDYLSKIKNQVLQTEIPPCVLSQVTAMRTFNIKTQHFLTTLEIDEHGDAAIGVETGSITT